MSQKMKKSNFRRRILPWSDCDCAEKVWEFWVLKLVASGNWLPVNWVVGLLCQDGCDSRGFWFWKPKLGTGLERFIQRFNKPCKRITVGDGVVVSTNVCWFWSITLNKIRFYQCNREKLYLLIALGFGWFESLVNENELGELLKRTESYFAMIVVAQRIFEYFVY